MSKNSIRVLYKKPKQAPIVKIISLPKLKKAIAKRNLDIIPYETTYIICHSKNLRKYMPINIVLSLGNIRGDIILINADKNKREFKGLSQEDVIWYTQDLAEKSIDIKPIKQSNTIKPKKDFEKDFERDFETSSSSTTNGNYSSNSITNNVTTNSFEKTLIGLLVNIELSLASLLKKGEKKK